VKKSSTVRKSGSKIFKEHQPTIGLDPGDRSSCYCLLDDRGEVIREGCVSTNKKAIAKVFGSMCRDNNEQTPPSRFLLSRLANR
jgi:hypothetical protein